MSIIIYELENCPMCKMLKAYLDSLSVKYEVQDAQNFVFYLKNNGFGSVPVLEIDNRLFPFQSTMQILSLLREHGYDI